MNRSPSDASFLNDPAEPSLEKAISELPIEDRDDSFLPEEDRDLTPEEQIEELKAMLREGRIGIHAVRTTLLANPPRSPTTLTSGTHVTCTCMLLLCAPDMLCTPDPLGLPQFHNLHTKAWTKVLENQGADSPTQAKLRYQNSRKLSATGSAVDLVTVRPTQPTRRRTHLQTQ